MTILGIYVLIGALIYSFALYKGYEEEWDGLYFFLMLFIWPAIAGLFTFTWVKIYFREDKKDDD